MRPTRGPGTDDRLDAAHEQLTKAVEQLVTGEDWGQMLAVAARFHRYSLNNILLIQAQMPNATQVAGYRTWQALGHQVRRGEHGLAILAPVLRRRPALEDPNAPTQQPLGGVGTNAPRRLVGWKVTKVFDISQTDGPPLPEVAPELLSGDAPAHLFDGLAAQVAAAGFALRRADCGGANGLTNFASRTVTIPPDRSDAQAAKSLAHELAHVRLHEEEKYRSFEGSGCRGLAEIEAESVAHLVCQAAGLQTGDYSFPYVARWSGGDIALVRSAAERSLGAARTITASLGLTPAAPELADQAVLARTRSNAVSRARPPFPTRPTRSAQPTRGQARGISQ